VGTRRTPAGGWCSARRPCLWNTCRSASDIEPEPVVWAWEDDGAGRIPAGSFGLFAGREGTGKSSFLIRLAAQVTKGELDGALKGEPRPVIYVAVEDSWKYTIVPRLMAAGADRTMVYRAEVQTVEGDTVTLSLPYDNKLLEEAISEHQVALVALDPLMSAISDHLDTHVNRQVRQALDPLARMADRTGCIVGGIAHFNKSSGTDASSLITVSGAFKDVARFIFAFAVDEEDGGSVITQTKNSLGRSNLPSLAYRITEATVPTAKGEARVGRLVVDGPTDRDVRDLLGAQDRGERNEEGRAEAFLKAALGNGPRATAEIEDEAKHGQQIAHRTLVRARKELRIAARKIGAEWYIALPEHEGDLKDFKPPESKTGLPAKSANSAKPSSPGLFGTVGTLPAGDIAGAYAKSAKPAKPGPPGVIGGDGGLEMPGTSRPAKTAKNAASRNRGTARQPSRQRKGADVVPIRKPPDDAETGEDPAS
jgi:hypothetical protein